MLVVPGLSQGSVSSGKVFVCRALEVLGELRVVPVVAVGGLIPELPVAAGSVCAALGHLGEGALAAVEVLQAGLGWVSSGCAVCVLLVRSHSRSEAGKDSSDLGAFEGLCVVPASCTPS